jgi:hypothetical protein
MSYMPSAADAVNLDQSTYQPLPAPDYRIADALLIAGGYEPVAVTGKRAFGDAGSTELLPAPGSPVIVPTPLQPMKHVEHVRLKDLGHIRHRPFMRGSLCQLVVVCRWWLHRTLALSAGLDTRAIPRKGYQFAHACRLVIVEQGVS